MRSRIQLRLLQQLVELEVVLSIILPNRWSDNEALKPRSNNFEIPPAWYLSLVAQKYKKDLMKASTDLRSADISMKFNKVIELYINNNRLSTTRV